MTVTINFTGGIVSPGYLKDILETAEICSVKEVRFGLRQQMKFEVPVKYVNQFSKLCAAKNISFYTGRNALPNIISSYPAANIFTEDTWLKEGAYKDIFYGLDHKPQLKINVCDRTQSFVPFFTGHINWIASESAHYWYLYVRFPKTHTLYCWNELVYSNDVAAVSKRVEEIILKNKEEYFANDNANGNKLFTAVKKDFHYTSKKTETELKLPKFALPYYEGINKFGNNYWFGIYMRDQMFAVNFLIDVCNICLQTKIGQLYTTTWKTIIVKGIEQEHRRLWEFVLGKYRINVRHAANELNWQVGDSSDDGLVLKRHIIRYFDKEDVRTFGLSFAVQMHQTSSMFGSIIIRKQQNKNPGKLKSLERFDILYNPDFNPNSGELILFRDAVEKDHIGTYLVSLCKMFYERESSHDLLQQETVAQSSAKAEVKKNKKILHQCKHCFTVYDETVGDLSNEIEAGTTFEALPETYTCPLCDAGKKDFIEIEENKLSLQV